MHKIKLISYFLIAMLTTSCTNDYELKEGDFLFQDMDCGSMCDAIEEVTTGINGARLSHVGWLIIENDTLKVAEAISAGVVLTPLNDFVNRSRDAQGNPKIIVGRFKKEHQYLIPEAKKQLERYIGAPYNHSFLMNDKGYYCSQLLYLIFKQANKGKDIFTLSPMTFKQPGSDSFYPVWIDYYQKLRVEIPEGEPGINPGGMSQSNFIEITHSMGKPDGWNNLP